VVSVPGPPSGIQPSQYSTTRSKPRLLFEPSRIFDPLWSWPKPIQTGGPKILLGSKSKRGLERVVEYCDGWMPLGGPGTETTLGEGVRELRTLCVRAGRRFESLELAVIGLGPQEDTAQRLVASGFQHIIFTLPPAGADQTLPILDTYANLAHKLGSKTA